MLKTREQIKSWLNKHEITNYTINDDLSVDANRDVCLYNKNLTEIPVQFNKVNGYFWCSFNKLTSLFGAPKVVKGNFYCYNNQLTSLEFLPEVSGKIVCDKYLKDTKERNAMTKQPTNSVYCDNNQLTSLECSPKEVKGEFWCIYDKLTSLENLPEIYGELVCDEYLKYTKKRTNAMTKQPTNSVYFEATTEGIKQMATYVAQLVREGIVYEAVRYNESQFRVSTTGGY